MPQPHRRAREILIHVLNLKSHLQLTPIKLSHKAVSGMLLQERQDQRLSLPRMRLRRKVPRTQHMDLRTGHILPKRLPTSRHKKMDRFASHHQSRSLSFRKPLVEFRIQRHIRPIILE